MSSSPKKRVRVLIKINNQDDLYAVINKAQFSDGKEVKFELKDRDLQPVIENVLKDCEVNFSFVITENDRLIYTVQFRTNEETRKIHLKEMRDELEEIEEKGF